MKSILLLIIVVIGLLIFYYKPSLFDVSFEGFKNKVDAWWTLQKSSCPHFMDAHGSAPPGVGASPGKIQYEQNATSPSVNRMYANGNPQNTYPEFKMQPGSTQI